MLCEMRCCRLLRRSAWAFPTSSAVRWSLKPYMRFLDAAVKTKDIPIVVGCIIVVSVIVGITNLVVDLLYAVVDPRVQLGK